MLFEIWATYVDRLLTRWPLMLAAAVTAGAALAGLRYAAHSLSSEDRVQRLLRALPYVALAVAVVAGTRLAYERASLFDDAFISFRFVENFLHGHGLVWNLDERVEGYTNFLWVMIVAGLSALSGREPAEAGLWASLAVFPLSLWTIFRLERALADEQPVRALRLVPIATVLTAIQDSFVTAGTSGLETGFAALLVLLGVLRLVRAGTVLDWAITGLYLILATLTRPDHAVFYAVASGVLVWEHAPVILRLGRPGLATALHQVLAFAAPFALYAAHTLWRVGFYGEWLPNTFYAKSADGTYFSQGAAYATTFYLGSQLWFTIPAFAAYVLWPSRDLATRRFKRFAGIAFLLFNLYVLKVGGDFMFGRFYVTLVPLILVSLSCAVHELLEARRPYLGYALAAALAATAGGVSVLEPGEVRWGIADERTIYPVTSTRPIVIDSSNYRVGRTLRRWRDAGLHLRIATSGIGMVGYYSRMELIDLMGLTDATVARQPIEARGRPGHEKRASPAYIQRRMPHLVRGYFHPERHERAVHFDFGASITHRPWFVYHYDNAVMERIRQLTPSASFLRFDRYLKRYIKDKVPKARPSTLDQDDLFFRRFYFDHNDDPKLLARWTKALAMRRAKIAKGRSR